MICGICKKYFMDDSCSFDDCFECIEYETYKDVFFKVSMADLLKLRRDSKRCFNKNKLILSFVIKFLGEDKNE